MNSKTQNAVIAILVVTTIILGGLLAGSLMTTQPAQASSPAGINQYMMCAINYQADRSVLFVIDVLNGRMNTYTLNGTKTIIEAVPNPQAQHVDLKTMFGIR